MPSVSAPAKVLVSGSSGFIAIWVVRYLLEHGFAVRGTVRSVKKGQHLLNTFKGEAASGQFELAIVPDMSAPGAFDEAVKGVDAIEHTASPAHIQADDPDELIMPAVNGTTGLLESAIKFAGPQLRRIVVTSSCATVFSPSSHGEVDESCWNEESVDEVNKKGRLAGQMDKYRASKVLAEKSAWKLANDLKGKISWDLVTINPTLVLGPILQEVEDVNSLNTSLLWFYKSLVPNRDSANETGVAFLQGRRSWVDVRDVAAAHVRALEVPEAGGQRFIISAGAAAWQDWLDVANELKIPGVDLQIGTPGSGKNVMGQVVFSSKKSRDVLGIQYIDMRTTAKDTITSYKEHGW